MWPHHFGASWPPVSGQTDQGISGETDHPKRVANAVEATIFWGQNTCPKMANLTISMSKIRKILRMYSQGRSILFIAAQIESSRITVRKYLNAFKSSDFTFEEVNALNDKELEAFFGKTRENNQPSSRMLSMQRCFPHVDKELKKTGMNRQLLWEAYYKEFPDGYLYSQFCFLL